MDAGLHHLSVSAAQLIQQKSLMTSDEFNLKMEHILQSLAQFNDQEADNNELFQLGLLEKMSFEIRTPMNSILGFTGLLKDSYFTIEEKDEFITLIEKNTEQLIELLNDLTDLGKIENFQVSLRMEKFELNVFLLNIMSEFGDREENKRLKLTKKFNKELPQDVCVYTDPYQLKKIIQILLLNLSRFSSTSNIEIYSDIIEENKLEIKIKSDQRELPETISRSIKKHITNIQGQTNFDGTGLKLTITKALVDLLNGDIDFKCIPEEGSVFILRIPVKVCSIH